MVIVPLWFKKTRISVLLGVLVMSNPKSKKNTDISLSSNALFFKFMHHFGDWDFETGYMTRIERSIYFDMKSFYLRTGKPLTDDVSMLERYLRCTTDEEKTALQFLLADKFTHCKKTKRYKHREWDLMIKNYRHAHRNDVTQDGRRVTDDVTPDVTDDVTQNDRIKALRKRNKLMINALKNIGVNVNSRTPSKELQALCEKHNIDVTQFDVTQNSNDVTQHGNDVTDDVTQNELEKSCYNQEPLTINQEPVISESTHTGVGENLGSMSKAEQIRLERMQDIQDWKAPTLEMMWGILANAGFTGTLSQQQYDLAVNDFKNYYAEQALVGKPLNTDNLRKDKLRNWIMNNKQPQGVKSNATYQSNLSKRPTTAQFTGKLGEQLGQYFGQQAERPVSDSGIRDVYPVENVVQKQDECRRVGN